MRCFFLKHNPQKLQNDKRRNSRQFVVFFVLYYIFQCMYAIQSKFGAYVMCVSVNCTCSFRLNWRQKQHILTHSLAHWLIHVDWKKERKKERQNEISVQWNPVFTVVVVFFSFVYGRDARAHRFNKIRLDIFFVRNILSCWSFKSTKRKKQFNRRTLLHFNLYVNRIQFSATLFCFWRWRTEIFADASNMPKNETWNSTNYNFQFLIINKSQRVRLQSIAEI